MTVEERLDALSKHKITLNAYMVEWDLFGDIAVILSRLNDEEVLRTEQDNLRCEAMVFPSFRQYNPPKRCSKSVSMERWCAQHNNVLRGGGWVVHYLAVNPELIYSEQDN